MPTRYVSSTRVLRPGEAEAVEVPTARALPGAVLGFVRRHWAGFIFLGFALLIWGYGQLAPDLPPEPPEQIQSRRAAQLDQAKAQAAATARQRALCNQQTICTKFATARQECATAGNYKNCVDIKMGKDAIDLYPCMNDGRVWSEPADMQNRFQCFIQSIQ